MSIIDNPFRGPEWEPLAHIFNVLLDDLRAGTSQSFSIQTWARLHNGNPERSPHLQARVNFDGHLQMELSGNVIIDPPLSPEQYQNLEFYGWTPPTVSPEEFRANEPGNPNFVRFFDKSAKTEDITEFVLLSLVAGCGLEVNDLYDFRSRERSERVHRFRKLDRFELPDANRGKYVFALPGRHEELMFNRTDDNAER